MRTGVAVSLVGHVGAVMITLMAFPATTVTVSTGGSVVPVDIVNIAEESNVRALAMEVTEEAEAPEMADQMQEASASAPTPRERQRPTAQQEQDDFLASVRETLEDRSKERGQQQQEGTRADRNQRGAGRGTADEASLRDLVGAVGFSHMRRCWRIPADLPNPDRLVVVVEVDINRNGTINGQPRVTQPRNYTFDPYMRAAAEAALRAVRQCEPFPFPDHPRLSDRYDLWRQTEIIFDPSRLP